MSAFTGSLRIEEVRPGKRWRLLDPIKYEAGEKGSGLFIEVPAGFETDGATLPPALRIILAVWGSYGRAAALHDYLYSILREGRLWGECPSGRAFMHPAFAPAYISPDLPTSYTSARRWADEQFYHAARACGTSRPLAWLMWAAVRVFGAKAARRA